MDGPLVDLKQNIRICFLNQDLVIGQIFSNGTICKQEVKCLNSMPPGLHVNCEKRLFSFNVCWIKTTHKSIFINIASLDSIIVLAPSISHSKGLGIRICQKSCDTVTNHNYIL